MKTAVYNQELNESMIGKAYSQLTVIAIKPPDPTTKTPTLATCRCSCGTVKDIPSVNVRSGNTKSCGCLGRATRTKANINRDIPVHGGAGTRLYSIWSRIRRDTLAGRFTCAEEWAQFVTFQAWAAKEEYTHGDRLRLRDESLGYTPSNCYWFSPSTPAKRRVEREEMKEAARKEKAAQKAKQKAKIATKRRVKAAKKVKKKRVPSQDPLVAGWMDYLGKMGEQKAKRRVSAKMVDITGDVV